MNASMARHTEDEKKTGTRVKRLVQPVTPALPLRPVKRQAPLNKAKESHPLEDGVEHGTSERLPSGGWVTPDHALGIQFGELEGDHEQIVGSPARSLNQSISSVDIAPSPLPSGTFTLRQSGLLSSQEVLPDASSNNDTLTQATSSRPSSAPPPLKIPSHKSACTPQPTLQTSVVELPAEASISRSSSLQISFLYQKDLDSISSGSVPCSRSPIVVELPTMSQPTGSGTSSLKFSEPTGLGYYRS
jgi:hypothetical protein